jgi:hypothetical protein
MPVPGRIAFEQLRVGPSIEMSLRKTWASILADACEESGAQSVLHRCARQFSRGPRGFAIFSFLWAVSVRRAHSLVARTRTSHSNGTSAQCTWTLALEGSPAALVLFLLN